MASTKFINCRIVTPTGIYPGEVLVKEGIIDITREGSEVELDPSIMKIVKDIKYKIVKEQLYIPKTKEELNSWINENKYITN